MPEPRSPRDLQAQAMADGREVMTPLLAQQLRRDGIEEVDSARERELFWQRALTDEQEAVLWQQELLSRGLTQLTPEQADVAAEIGLGISQKVYPARWDMMAAAGRNTPAEQATWAAKHAEQGPPTPKAEEGAA